MATITPELARQYNADGGTGAVVAERSGVLVVKVTERSPAAEAGMQLGDVVVKVDGQQVRSTGQLQGLVEAAQVGQALSITALRGDLEVQLTAVTGDMQAGAKE